MSDFDNECPEHSNKEKLKLMTLIHAAVKIQFS